MTIAIELKSYPKFATYQTKIDKQVEQLQSRIDKTQEQLEAVKNEYAEGFADGKDLTKVSNRLKKIQDDYKHLQSEMYIISNNNFHEKKLARKVYDEYMELESKVRDERSRLFKQAEQIKKNANEEIEKLDKEVLEMIDKMNTEINPKLREVVDYLEIGEQAKDNFKTKISSGVGVLSYSDSFSNILKRQYN